MSGKFSVLLVCTGNSCRSQMAEGLVRHFMGDRVRVESAGVLPGYVHPLAIKVLEEIGIDTSTLESKHIDRFEGEDFDLVVTLCGHARDVCGVFPWAKEQVHMGFDDPIGTYGSEDDVHNAFIRVRNEIRDKLLPLIEQKIEEQGSTGE